MTARARNIQRLDNQINDYKCTKQAMKTSHTGKSTSTDRKERQKSADTTEQKTHKQ